MYFRAIIPGNVTLNKTWYIFYQLNSFIYSSKLIFTGGHFALAPISKRHIMVGDPDLWLYICRKEQWNISLHHCSHWVEFELFWVFNIYQLIYQLIIIIIIILFISWSNRLWLIMVFVWIFAREHAKNQGSQNWTEQSISWMGNHWLYQNAFNGHCR